MTDKRDSDKPERKPDTRLVTGGRDPFSYYGFVNPPVYHASTVLYRTADDLLASRGRFHY
jgi:cystathionine beta-lyase